MSSEDDVAFITLNPFLSTNRGESQLHKRWIYTFGRMDAFLKRFVKGGTPTTAGQSPE